jgi:hypothetical protein
MSSSRRKLQVLASLTVLLLMALAIGCNGFFVDPILQSIAVGPSGSNILVGRNRQLTATATDDTGRQTDITGTALWSSDDETVATVSGSGLVTGVAVGSANISASSGTVSGSASITVSLTGINSILVTPSSQSVSATGGVPFCLKAVATSSSGDTDISTLSSTTWTFTDPSNTPETGITKTTNASCAGQAFEIGTLSPTQPTVALGATASAAGASGTVTSNKVTVNVTP